MMEQKKYRSHQSSIGWDKIKTKSCECMEERNYKPSVLTSALTGKRTSTIGFLLPDIANPLIAVIACRFRV